jgi:2-keto-4-pentenoate hydratase/2-oxohepta-3-ene-1,7-dioic acid hydratase in catechol pathway
MKLVNFRQEGEDRLGLVDGGRVIDINAALPHVPVDLRQALVQEVDWGAVVNELLAQQAPRLNLADLDLAPPMRAPGKIICLGLNYFDHAKEGGREKPEYPWFFLRSATSLLAPDAKVMRPRVSERLDYEAELAVVIGKRIKHATLETALDAVFGYTCFNDVSVRDYQKKTPQWTIGKNFDRTGAFGPVLVTADELPVGAKGLRIQCRLNGEVMQSADTSDMIWSVAETIQLLTECVTLEPGDVIVMGTPAGVGQSRKPQVWMKQGDEVEVEIERIGLLRNTVEDEA